MRSLLLNALLCVSLLVTTSFWTQQLPQLPRNLCAVRNDSNSELTIEYQAGGEWKSIKLEPGKDTPISADRLRVATVRDDKATVTVDLPVAPAAKYRVLWNKQAGMWDFSTAAGSAAPQ